MVEKYRNNDFEILKSSSATSPTIKKLIKEIDEEFKKYNKYKSKYTIKYIEMMENQFDNFDALDYVYTNHGGRKKFVNNIQDNSQEIKDIENSLCKYCEKLNALRYLSFLSEENRNVVMIGPNGCGKTTLLRYLIKNTDNSSSNIGYYQADRLLVVNDDYRPQRDKTSFLKTMTNDDEMSTNIETANPSYYIGQQFDEMITLLEKKRSIELEKNYKQEIKSDKLITQFILKTWNSLIQDRKLYFDDGLCVKTLDGVQYQLKYLSSGEKNILYFLVKILLLDEKKYYFIDEPENSLNPSVVSKLWTIIEKKKKDSIFIYLTHDSEFVSTRINAKIYWIKKYNGNNNWEYEELKENNNLPQELMISLVGNKQPVLFCESENENKYDTLLFKILFPSFKIVSAGGCKKVIAKVKAYGELGLPQTAYGIIDCDYNSEDYLKSYEAKNIFHIPFFEVENFLVCSKILEPFLKRYSQNLNSFIEVKSKVKEVFKASEEKYVIRNVASELHALSLKDGINKLKTIKELQASFKIYQDETKIDDLINKYKERAEEIIEKDDYDTFLRYLDQKNIINVLIPCMCLKEGVIFEEDILDFLSKNDELLSDIRNCYFPEIQPIIQK